MKNQLLQSPVQVRKSAIQGYGVFATRDIQEGEVIEECPVLFLSQKHFDLVNYAFDWLEPESKNILTTMLLGYGCVYNHADDPNAFREQDNINNLMIFKALKNIKKNEEIFIYYASNWFESRGTKPISSKQILIKSRKKFISIAIKFGIIVAAVLFIKFVLLHSIA